MNKMECKRAPLEFLELTYECEKNLRRSGIDSINDLLRCSLKDLKRRKSLTKKNISQVSLLYWMWSMPSKLPEWVYYIFKWKRRNR